MPTKTVDEYLKAKPQWTMELTRLRDIILACKIEETIKWGAPVYTAYGQNIVGLAGFKNHYGLWFFQGALLKDEKKVLANAQEGKTKAMRQWRMESAKDIKPALIRAYVKEAVANAAAGAAIKPDRNKRLIVPAMLKTALAADQKAAEAFKALTPGRRREYADHIRDAKQDATKARRIRKIMPMIKAGAGLNDRYKGC